MDEESFDCDRPPDETWWLRELHRNEKLMDKYMAVLGDNPDWDKWKNPDDLYNKVHFDIDPPERTAGEEELEEQGIESSKPAADDGPAAEIEDLDEDALGDSDWEDPDEDPEVNGDYPGIARQAREFACRVFDLEEVPG